MRCRTELKHRAISILYRPTNSGVVLKNEVGERLEIEVETVAKSAILQKILHSVSPAIFETVEYKNIKKLINVIM